MLYNKNDKDKKSDGCSDEGCPVDIEKLLKHKKDNKTEKKITSKEEKN